MIRVRKTFFGTVRVGVTPLPGGELATMYTLAPHKGASMEVAELLEYSVGGWTESWWFRARGSDAFERVYPRDIDMSATPAFTFPVRP
jgi:hypothetical protein